MRARLQQHHKNAAQKKQTARQRSPLHSATSVAPAAFVENPTLHFLQAGVGSFIVPPVLYDPASQAVQPGPPRPGPQTHVPLMLLYARTSVQDRHMVLSLTMHNAQPGAQPSKVLWPGTAAKGPFVGKLLGAGVTSGLVAGPVEGAGDDVELGVEEGAAVPGL